jgi:PAS domain S-box-containing protein
MAATAPKPSEPDFWQGIVARFTPDGVLQQTEAAFRAKVIIIFSIAVSIWGPIYGAVLYGLAGSVAAVVTLLTATLVIGVGTPILMKKGVSFTLLGHWLSLHTFLIVSAVAWLGFGAESLWWQSIVVILAVLLCSVRAGLFWLVLSVINLIVYYSLVERGAIGTMPFDGSTQVVWEISVMSGLYVVVGLLTLAYESMKEWALEQIRSKQAHTQAILDAAPDAIITLEANGQIDAMNHTAATIFGYDTQQVVRHAPFTTLVPTADPSVGLDALKGSSHEVEGVRRDGSRFPLELSLQPIEADGRYVVILRDITERKQAQNALREARDSAVKASQAKSTFLANMSHELRTPLNAIMGYSELVGEELEAMGHNEFSSDLAKVGVAGEHLLSLINDILDISKIEAGHSQLYLETIDLHKLLEDIVTTVVPVVEQNANTLKVDIEQAPATLHSDLTKLRQILLNLLSNAAKFTEESIVRLHAFAEAHDATTYCVIEVVDRGIGIPQEHQDRLFEAFEQADASTTREYGGTGLGLAITKRFTEMLGGTITVSSAVGEGSTFRVKLPVEVDEPIEDQDSAADSHTGPYALDSEARDLSQPIDDHAPSVLVIDDDPTVHELMRQFLHREGFAVHSATDGATGIEMARQYRPDVITLDVMMSEMDGWSVLGELKKVPEVADTPVIMVTIVSNKNLGYSLGASEYLLKPVNRGRLVEVLQGYVDTTSDRPVLIIEDDTTSREMLERTVELEGWSVSSATTGTEAIAKLEDGLLPSVILLDIMMPEMDGFGVLERLEERAEWAEIPVVVVSAADLTAEERNWLSAHVQQVLRKGEYTPQEVIDQIRQAHDHDPRNTEVSEPQLP